MDLFKSEINKLEEDFYIDLADNSLIVEQMIMPAQDLQQQLDELQKEQVNLANATVENQIEFNIITAQINNLSQQLLLIEAEISRIQTNLGQSQQQETKNQENIVNRQNLSQPAQTVQKAQEQQELLKQQQQLENDRQGYATELQKQKDLLKQKNEEFKNLLQEDFQLSEKIEQVQFEIAFQYDYK